MKREKIDKALFIKFAEGKCTREEIDAIIRYLQQSKEGSSLPGIEELGMDLPEMSEEQAERVFRRLQAEISREAVPTRSRRMYNHWYKVAAVLIGVVIAAGLYRFYLSDETVRYTTNFGETRHIDLADGTSVVLNANSTLSYNPSSFVKKENEDLLLREVWLTGEAYFHVRKQADSSRFTVHTERLMVEVLGTEFNVKHRRGKTEVSLATGKVKLKTVDKASPQEIEMKPGEFVELPKDEEIFSKKHANPGRHSFWKENNFTFEDQRLDEIALFIEDYYGVKVIINDDAFAGRRFTGSAPADSLDILLDKLVTLFDFELIQEKDKVILK